MPPPSAGYRVSTFSNRLCMYALLIPLPHTHSVIMGFECVLFSHHLNTDTPSVGLSLSQICMFLFEGSSERFGESVRFLAESRGAFCGEFFARSSLLLRTREYEVRPYKGETGIESTFFGLFFSFYR